jgi:hypothetical protein
LLPVCCPGAYGLVASTEARNPADETGSSSVQAMPHWDKRGGAWLVLSPLRRFSRSATVVLRQISRPVAVARSPVSARVLVQRGGAFLLSRPGNEKEMTMRQLYAGARLARARHEDRDRVLRMWLRPWRGR